MMTPQDIHIHCPGDGLLIRLQDRHINKHLVRAPPGKPDHVEPDGVRASRLNADGWCEHSGLGYVPEAS